MTDDKKDRDGQPVASWTSGLQPPAQQAASRDEAEEGGFLRRWSRRKGAQSKTAGEKKAEPASQALPADFAEPPAEDRPELPPEAPVRGRMITSPPGVAPTANDAKEETEVEETDLPDVEEMDAESDFTPFLKKGVSEQLQRKALRKLWLSDPVLANVDGLLDYGDDFTDAAMVIENMKTVYTVGRGMVPEPVEPEAEVSTAEEPPSEELVDEDAASDESETKGDEGRSEDAGTQEAGTPETGVIEEGHDDADKRRVSTPAGEVVLDPTSKIQTENS